MYYFSIIILFGAVLTISFSCTQDGKSETKTETSKQDLEIPPDWQRFEVGNYTLAGPADMKLKTWQGEDASGYTLENAEFSFDVDISIYNTGQDRAQIYQMESGTILIYGKPRKFSKFDLNRPAGNAAVNADGSRSKPAEKHIVIEVQIPEDQTIFSVAYANEYLTHLAKAMLQSVRRTDSR